ncbi:VirB8/TrbF family protein [Rhodanobacter sp. 115]|uniref:VirB8/TrbF family protein n=1 Tax=Rhodanobacter sp. FW021-MT20 TaxID=1162282 RepID=UPI0034E499EC
MNATKQNARAVAQGKMNSPPPGVSVAGMQKYLSAFEAPRIGNRRLLAALVAISMVAALQAFGIFRMLPLHERIPYFVTVDPNTAAVSVSNKVAEKYTPSQASERYFLNKWVTDLLTIDPRVRERLPNTYAMLRGAALSEWNAFIFNNYKPLEQLRKNESLRIYPTVDAIGFIDDESAAIRVTLHSADGTTVRHLLVTVKFAILPPQTDADVYRNPIGLWITHFEVTDESTQP